jgi:Na+/melibiose symporter-like transporter
VKRNLATNNGGFKTADYLKITILIFAMSALWQSMHTVILQNRVLDFIPEAEKNTYIDILISTGAALAMIVQPIVGAISDRSGFRWGRRRPFILVGGITLLLLLPGIGWAGSFAALFAIYCLMQISSNTVQGPHQGFIPDLVPEGKRGLASGVKGFLEVLGGVALLYFITTFMGNYADGQGSQWLWLSLVMPGILILVFMVVTVLMVKERPGSGGLRIPSMTFSIDIKAHRNLLGFLISRLHTLISFFKANRNFMWFLASRLLFFMAMTIIQRHALYFLKDFIVVADPDEAVFRIMIITVVGMLAVVYPAGRLSDRIGRKPIAISSALMGALGIVIIILFQNYSSVLIAAGILGLATGAFTSTNWALATDLVVTGKEARYLGLANMSTAGASALVVFIGPVIDHYEKVSEGLGYQAMLIACLVFFILGGLLLLKVKGRVTPASPAPPPNPWLRPRQ